MSIRKIVKQIQELAPERTYAIVISHRLAAQELAELKALCEKVHVKALLMTDARVVPLDQLFGIAAQTTEGEIAKAMGAAKELGGWDGSPLPPGAMAASEDVPQDTGEAQHG